MNDEQLLLRAFQELRSSSFEPFPSCQLKGWIPGRSLSQDPSSVHGVNQGPGSAALPRPAQGRRFDSAAQPCGALPPAPSPAKQECVVSTSSLRLNQRGGGRVKRRVAGLHQWQQ